MTKRKDMPEVCDDEELDQATGGGVFQTPAGGWGKKTTTWTDHNTHDPGYIGETEKGVWKAPAGVTHDPAFEE